jgi:putative transposase
MPNELYSTDLTDAAWGTHCSACYRPQRQVDETHDRPSPVLDAIFYLLRTGCQWRLIPREFPAWGTAYHYFRAWKNAGVWGCIQAAL